MTPILTFARSGGRELIRLGEIAIGELAPFNGSPRVRAAFILRLPESGLATPRPAHSFEAARRAITREVSDWLVRAGVLYPGQLVDVATPCEGE